MPRETGVAQPAGSGDGWVKVAPSAGEKWEPLPPCGEVKWDEAGGVLRLGKCEDLTGVRWTGPPPVVPFEVELEARRVEGTDIFCGLTVPARGKDECVTLVVGGWGGQLVGISSIDGYDASENETSSQREFENGRWYRIRLRAEASRLQAWIDDEPVVDFETEGRRLSLRFGPIEGCAPFGLATWQTTGELRGVRWRPLAAAK